jgi:hypothetical protein
MRNLSTKPRFGTFSLLLTKPPYVVTPTLFLIYINDVTNNIKSSTYLYADDTKLVGSTNNLEGKAILEDDVANFIEWSKTWDMPINMTKCSFINFNKKSDFQLQEIGNSTSEKDLGVLVTSGGKFDHHIDKTVKKANKMLGLIKRSFKSRNPEVLTEIFKRYIVPVLTYCSPLWNPGYKNHIMRLEMVQKRFIRVMFGKGNYLENLKKVGLPTQEIRRRATDLILMHKIYHTKTPLKFSKIFEMSRSQKHTRGTSHKNLPVPKTNSNIRKHSFSVRCIKIWNDLPCSFRENDNLTMFKSNIYNYLI